MKTLGTLIVGLVIGFLVSHKLKEDSLKPLMSQSSTEEVLESKDEDKVQNPANEALDVKMVVEATESAQPERSVASVQAPADFESHDPKIFMEMSEENWEQVQLEISKINQQMAAQTEEEKIDEEHNLSLLNLEVGF